MNVPMRRNKLWGVMKDGIYLDLKDELTHWEDRKNKEIISVLRNEEADSNLQGKHILLCPFCEKALRIKYQKSINFPYLTHRFPDDSIKCISEQDESSELCKSIIRARKYEGRETGYLHKKVINNITDVLEALPDYHLLKKPEGKRLYHINGSKEYRIPDILFSYKGRKVVIEVQNSPEWIKIIAERRKFYKENNIVLIWVFTSNKLITDSASSYDIASKQQFNSFYFDNFCYKKSLGNQNLFLTCVYYKPTSVYSNKEYIISSMLTSEIVSFPNIIDSLNLPNHKEAYAQVEKDCILRNQLSIELNLKTCGMYYGHMLESAYFSRFLCFSEYIKTNDIQQLNNLAHCYISVMFLIKFLKEYNSENFAFSLDKTGALIEKIHDGIAFWKAVRDQNNKIVLEKFERNTRTTTTTIRDWKRTIQNSNASNFFPQFETFNKSILANILKLEKILANKK